MPQKIRYERFIIPKKLFTVHLAHSGVDKWHVVIRSLSTLLLKVPRSFTLVIRKK